MMINSRFSQNSLTVNLERVQRWFGKVDYWLATSKTVILVNAECSVSTEFQKKQHRLNLLGYMYGIDDRIGDKSLWGVLTDGTEWQFYEQIKASRDDYDYYYSQGPPRFMFNKINSNDLKLIVNAFMYLLE
jgi:hypothetical protein